MEWKRILLILSCTLDNMGYYVSIKKGEWSIFSDAHRNIQKFLEFSGSGCKARFWCPVSVMLAMQITNCHIQRWWCSSLWPPFVACSSLPIASLSCTYTHVWFWFFCLLSQIFFLYLNSGSLFYLKLRTLTVSSLRYILNRMGGEKSS